jgi:hypothetical protein
MSSFHTIHKFVSKNPDFLHANKSYRLWEPLENIALETLLKTIFVVVIACDGAEYIANVQAQQHRAPHQYAFDVLQGHVHISQG